VSTDSGMTPSTPSEGAWLRHKPEIRRLYLAEKKSLEDVRKSIELKGLVVTLV